MKRMSSWLQPGKETTTSGVSDPGAKRLTSQRVVTLASALSSAAVSAGTVQVAASGFFSGRNKGPFSLSLGTVSAALASPKNKEVQRNENQTLPEGSTVMFFIVPAEPLTESSS